MGLIRFVVSPPRRITEDVAKQAYLSGFDQVAWRVRAEVDGGELVLTRSVYDSANLHIPWQVEGHGVVALSTASLSEEPGVYQLPLELARGTISQLRNQLSEWLSIGLSVPPRIHEKISEATGLLGRAAVNQEDRSASAELAERAIRVALDAADLLAATYVDQALASRRRGGAKLSTWLGGDLGPSLLDDQTAGQFLRAFNAAVVPLCWRDVEASEGSFYWATCDKQVQWCRAKGLTVCGGPLLQLTPQALPDWLYLFEGDFDNLLSFVSEFLREAVGRYRGKFDLWQCAARLSSADILSFSEEEKLRLAAHTIELTRSIDSSTPTVVSFDQPWAEYMSRREMDFPPLHFADALVRAGLELDGLMLEINLGHGPGATLPRNPLEFSRQLDYWSVLGLPLFVSLSVPSAADDDPLARQGVDFPPQTWTPAAQQNWVARYVPLILSKSFVHGIIWNQLCDGQPHDFPHGGLFDRQGRPKPALSTLASIRQTYLQ